MVSGPRGDATIHLKTPCLRQHIARPCKACLPALFTSCAITSTRDQIIPASLNLVPTMPRSTKSLAVCDVCLPIALPGSLLKEGQLDSEYPVIVAGRNFGCGSSREHAPIAIGSARCTCIGRKLRAHLFPQLRFHWGALSVRNEKALRCLEDRRFVGLWIWMLRR